MDWTEFSEFEGIDLNDSFVLSWEQSSNNVIFNIEASIWPPSAYYTAPKQNEFTCYRQATLLFKGTKNISGLKPIQTIKPTVDPDGTSDYGNIESLKRNSGGFIITGEFGVVEITGGKLEFKVHT